MVRFQFFSISEIFLCVCVCMWACVCVCVRGQPLAQCGPICVCVHTCTHGVPSGHAGAAGIHFDTFSLKKKHLLRLYIQRQAAGSILGFSFLKRNETPLSATAECLRRQKQGRIALGILLTPQHSTANLPSEAQHGLSQFFSDFSRVSGVGRLPTPRVAVGGALHSQPPPSSPLSCPCMWLNLVCMSGLQRRSVRSAPLLGHLGQRPLWEAR